MAAIARLLKFEGPAKVEWVPVTDPPVDTLDADIGAAVDGDLAETDPIIPSPARPIDLERQTITDRIAALGKERDVLVAERADFLARAEAKHELIRQTEAMIVGKRADLATLDAYQPTQMAAE